MGRPFVSKNVVPAKTDRHYGEQARIIYERYTGLALKPEDTIHHKDGNRSNNSIENLEVMSHNEHTYLHRYGKGKYGIPSKGNESEWRKTFNAARAQDP